MNNIIFKKIVLDSFLSYDHEELEINQAGVVFIKGENGQDSKSDSNGSGKSALVSESLLWCLTGRTSRNADEVKNLYLPRGASVTVVLEKNDIEYTITRGTIGSAAANGLTIIKNGENVTKSKIRETEEYFETEFPELTWSVLTSIVILSQGLIGGLSTMNNRDRKEKLEELSKVDMIYNNVKGLADTVELRYQSKWNILQKQIYENSIKSGTNDSMIKSLLDTITNIKAKNTTVSLASDADAGISAYEDLVKANVESYEKTQQSILQNSDLKEKIVADLRDLTTTYNLQAAEQSSLEMGTAKLRQEIAKFTETMTRTRQELDALKDNECPTCHQEVDKDLTDNLRKQLLQSLSDTKELATADVQKVQEWTIALGIVKETTQFSKSQVDNLEQQNSQYSSIIRDLNTESRRLIMDREELNNKIKQLLNLKAIKVESTDAYEVKIVELTDSNKVLQAEEVSLNREASKVEAKLTTAKWFTSQMSRGLRSYMLGGVIEFLNMRCAEYSGYLFDSDKVALVVDNSSLDIFLGEKQIENTSGGEHRRADIILQLAIRDLVMSEAGFASNLLIIDEVFDHLDSLGVSTVLDLITNQKSTINSIFLITHKNDADIDYDNMLVVRKENNISRVVK